MTYHVQKVTLVREIDGIVVNTWSFIVDHKTDDINSYRKSQKEKYRANRVYLTYEERSNINEK